MKFGRLYLGALLGSTCIVAVLSMLIEQPTGAELAKLLSSSSPQIVDLRHPWFGESETVFHSSNGLAAEPKVNSRRKPLVFDQFSHMGSASLDMPREQIIAESGGGCLSRNHHAHRPELPTDAMIIQAKTERELEAILGFSQRFRGRDATIQRTASQWSLFSRDEIAKHGERLKTLSVFCTLSKQADGTNWLVSELRIERGAAILRR